MTPPVVPPFTLTILRQGERLFVDLAEVGTLIPRGETRIEDAFLREVAAELRLLATPGFGHDNASAESTFDTARRQLQRVGTVIFSHLLPESTQHRLRMAAPGDLYLRLDEQLLALPWELAYDGQDFLATKFCVGRQVITSQPLPGLGAARIVDGPLKVLLIADPTETLPQAAMEVERLCAVLEEVPDVEVTLLGGKNVRKLSLLAAVQEHAVVHFAGHSVYDPKAPGESGWRLYEGLLTARELGKLAHPPQVVFSNSCQASATTGWVVSAQDGEQGFGLGSAFLLAGVPNYVGPCWVVDDMESVEFALAFYRQVAARRSIGEALCTARQAMMQQSGGKNLTWASYVLYGDPRFKLLATTRTSPLPDSPATTPPQPVGVLQRKLAAILSADVQGYSRLMGEDEEGTVRTLTAYRQVMATLIVQHHGRVVDAPGDNLLAEFASAVDALQGAVAIQRAFRQRNAALPSSRQMRWRIGLNVGDVLVEGERLYGDGVNIAARLEALAEGGGICISGTVHDQVENKLTFSYDYLGEQTVKNIAKPVRVYRVQLESGTTTPPKPPAGQSLPPPRDTPEVLLIGREKELERLHQVLARVRRGERQVVFITGEPGIGKTTLVDAFLRQVAAQGELWLGQGQCIEQYGPGEPYMPILEALGRLCRQPGGEQLTALLHQYAPTWLVQMPSLLRATDLDTLQRKVQGATRERMLREMAEALDVITTKRPLVLWLEDLHWSDVSTLELLALLARRRESARLLILGTYRPVDVAVQEHPLKTVKQELQLHGHCEEVAVQLLTEEAVEEYLAVRIPMGVPDMVALQPLAHTIHHRTEGNPLFMVNVVDELLAQRQIDTMSIEKSMPATIREMIEQQLERLRDDEQKVTEMASVAGMEFSAATVAAGTGTTIDDVEQQCAVLAWRGQFLQAKGAAEWPDGTIATRYGFLHALYQEVTYERIPMGRRVILHHRIGERIEAAYGERAKELATELAVHFERGREYQKAVQYLQQAGDLASKRMALREAIAYLNQGMKVLGMLPPSTERDRQELDLRIALGMAWLGLQGWTAPEVWTSLHPALALAKSLGRRTALLPIYYGLWNHVDSQGRIAESLDWVHEMLATAEAEGDMELLIVAHRAACDTYFWLGDFTQSRVHGERVLALYDEERHHYVADLLHGDPKSKVATYMSHDIWMLGYPDRAVQESEAAVTHARRRGHAFDLGWVLASSSIVWACRGAPEQILARTEEAERLGRTHDLPFISDVLAQHWKGVAWLRAGRLAEAIPQLQRMLETWKAHGAEIGMPCFRTVLAEGLTLSGDVTGALRLVEESLTQIARPGWEERWYLAEVLRLKGWMLTLQGDLAGAEQHYLASLDVAREQHAKSWELRTATSLARLWQQQGKTKEAHKLLSEIYNWFTEGFDTKDLQEAKALLRDLGEKAKRENGEMDKG